MMWRWIITSAAERQLDRLDPALRNRITRRLDDITEDIGDPGIRKLHGDQGFRLRVGNFRVIFRVDWETQTIVVTRIGDRKDVYR
jgi:mRNA interferase RelE/StbE